MPRTRVNGSQIDFEGIFSVENILLSNGFVVNGVGSKANTFAGIVGDEEAYKLFSDSKKVTDLVKAIHNGDDFLYSEVLNTKIKSIANKEAAIKLFSNTFEWYIGKAIVKEFKAFSSAYGVEIETAYGHKNVGDFDVLAVLRNLNLIYIECKLRKNDKTILKKEHILKTINRSNAIHSIASIIILNSEIDKEKLINDVKYIKYPLREWHGNILEFSTTRVNGPKLLKWYDTYIIQSTKYFDGLIDNLRLVFQLISCTSFMKSKDVGACAANNTTAVEYRKLGYQADQLIDQNCT